MGKIQSRFGYRFNNQYFYISCTSYQIKRLLLNLKMPYSNNFFGRLMSVEFLEKLAGDHVWALQFIVAALSLFPFRTLWILYVMDYNSSATTVH